MTKPLPPNPRDPTYDDILAIARLIEAGSRFSEFRLKSGDIEVEVKRGNVAAPVAAPSQAAAAAPAPPPSAKAASEARNTVGHVGAESPGELPHGTEVIRAPMVGTFYRAPDPAAPPFVQQGSRVQPDTILCILEVMKLMNSVSAGVSGVVSHIFVENAQMVEHGQPLIAVKVDQ